MKHTLARIVALTALGAVVSGCATVPGDGYYDPNPYYSSGGYYSTPGYSSPVYPAYAPAPSVVYYGDRDDRWDRNRNDLRERDRIARDRADRERDRAARDRADRE